jgi:hypothetical protein
LWAAAPGAWVTIGDRRVRVPQRGWQPGEVVRHVQRYADRQRNARGLLIGRTETITAANAGQQAFWVRARRAGWIGPGARRRWVAAPTACPRCRVIAGQTAPLTEPFAGPDGPVMHPPVHPGCRCAVVLLA